MAEVDDWAPVKQDDWRPVEQDDWQPAQQSQSLWDRGAVRPTTLTTSDVGKVGEIGKMFGGHFEEGFTSDRLGFSRENYALVDEALKKHGVLAPDGKDKDASWRSPFYAMNSLIFQAVDSSIALGTLPLRTITAGYEAAKKTAIDLGLPKDVASLGDPFMANPHHLGIPKAPTIKPEAIKQVLVKGGMDEAAASRVALTGEKAKPREGPEMIVGATVTLDGKVYIAPNHALAIMEAESRGVDTSRAYEAANKNDWWPGTPNADGGFITSHGRVVSRQEAVDVLDKAGRLDVDKKTVDDMKNGSGVWAEDWDGVLKAKSSQDLVREWNGRPVDFFAASREELDHAHAILKEAEQDGSWLGDISGMSEAPEKIVGAAVRTEAGVFKGVTHATAASLAHDAGVDISKLNLDDIDGFVTSTGRYVSREEAGKIADAAEQRPTKGGRLESSTVDYSKGDYDVVTRDQVIAMHPDIPPERFQAPYYKMGREGTDSAGKLSGYPSLDEALEAAKIKRPTVDLVDANEARGLGVIGEQRPEATFTDSPSELADRAVPRSLSGAAPPEAGRGIPGHEPGEYDKRGKEWVDKIDEPEDVRDTIERIASENDYFPIARGGEASAAARDAVAEAAGVSVSDINPEQFSRFFDSDGKVRAVVQVLRQTAKDFSEAAKTAAADPTPENVAAATEAQLRHSHVVEYTMGLRAESGRTLAAWKDLLRQTEQTKAGVELRSQETTGKTPKGAADVVDAAGDVVDKLKAGKKPGLQKLVDAAKALVENADKPPKEGEPKPAMTPELKEMVDEARNVLKRFGEGRKEDVDLEDFRQKLTSLSTGDGSLLDTVEAARTIVEQKERERAEREAKRKPNTPEKDAEKAKAAADAKLVAAAKRLVAAADNEKPEIKLRPGEMKELTETVRQAVGRLRGITMSKEVQAFRAALDSGDTTAASQAGRDLVEAEGKIEKPKEKAAIVEFDKIMASARRVAKAEEPQVTALKEKLAPDLQEIIDNAKNAVKELQGDRKSELERLIDAAEKQAVDMTKQKVVKDPAEALPPELQALLDKTKRVVNRFGGIARGEKAALLLARTGRTFAEQEQLARSVSGLTPTQVAKVLEKLRTSPEAQKPGWLYWLWQQGLISGLVTHTGYAIVNTATVGMERVVSPFIAAVLDRARGQNTSVAAPLYANVAMIRALPDAFSAAAQAFKTGMRVPLESEMRLFERGEESPQTKGAGAAYMQTPGPDWGVWNRVFNETQLDKAAEVLGIPGKAANLMHTFFKVLSERASQSTRAFQAAHEEGLSGDAFWRRYQHHLDNPTDDALRGAVNDAYTGAFMAHLSPRLDKFATTLKTNPVTKWIFPFQHIPWNIERMSVEYSPFAILGPEMRGALLGQKGVPAQNLAIAKMAVGSSIIAYFMDKALSGGATGEYPHDQTERKRWEMLGIRPNSLQMGGYWVSMERLGPAGNVAHMGASLGQIIKNYDGQDDEALTKALWSSAVAAANQIGNEVGFQTLKNIMDSLGEERKAERFIAYQASSMMPFSSFNSQNASFMDPYQRKAYTLIDGIKNRIPFVRETLLPKRDPLFGTPLPNPSHHTLKAMGDVSADPIKLELDRLSVFPAPPADRIGNVKLPPKMYDQYQAVAGAMTHQALEAVIKQDGWQNMPKFARQEVIRHTISSARQAAAGYMQVNNLDLIRTGIEQRLEQINGNKPKNKLHDAP